MIRTVSRAVLALLATSVVIADDTEREEPEFDDELTDIEFLEYLGSWEESDADWLIFSVPEPPSEGADEPQEEEDESDS